MIRECVDIPLNATSVMLPFYLETAAGTPFTGRSASNDLALLCVRARYDTPGTGPSIISPTIVTGADLGKWESGGWNEIDSTNAPGWYLFGSPNVWWSQGFPQAVTSPVIARNVVVRVGCNNRVDFMDSHYRFRVLDPRFFRRDCDSSAGAIDLRAWTRKQVAARMFKLLQNQIKVTTTALKVYDEGGTLRSTASVSDSAGTLQLGDPTEV